MLVFSEGEFQRAAAAMPWLYQNLGAIVSRKLFQADRRAFDTIIGQVIIVSDEGGPPLLAFAVAASLAWHTCKATALLVDEDPGLNLLARTSAESPLDRGLTGATGVARVILTGVRASLSDTADELRRQYAYVVVHSREDLRLTGRHIRLAGVRILSPDAKNWGR